MYILRVILVLIVTIFDSLKVIIAMIFKGDAVFYKHAQKWSGRLLKIMGIKVERDIKPQLDAEKSYIFVSNHLSLADIPVLLTTLPGDCRIIYKKELEKIPVFGYGLKKSSFIGIDRSDPRKSMRSISDAVKVTNTGASIIIFPEGTRSETGEVGVFKRGAFLLAEKAGKPIVPVSLKGTNAVLPNGSLKFRPGKVTVKIDEVIDISGYGRDEMKTLKDEIREKIIGLQK